MAAPLNPKHLRFVSEYMVDYDATKAARRAGYAGAKTGARLIADPRILEQINKRKEEQDRRVKWTADKVLEEIGNIIETADSTRDKLKGLEMLGKFHKLFTDRVENVQYMTDLDRKLDELMEKMGPDGINRLLDQFDEAGYTG